MNEEVCLFEINTGCDTDPPVYVLANNLRGALAKYKNDVVLAVNSTADVDGHPPITAADVDDPVSIVMLGDAEQVIL